MIDYDLELRHLNDVLRRSYGIRASDRVLDVGCGTGQTTREAARLATAGAVLGIDRSDAMIERARALARAAGLGNVEYECADVERHALPREGFDVVISRFGTSNSSLDSRSCKRRPHVSTSASASARWIASANWWPRTAGTMAYGSTHGPGSWPRAGAESAPAEVGQTSLLRAQGFHRVEPQGAVRRYQAGDQRNKSQRGPHGGERQRI
jgi:SAM-dependent methyltransferase